MLALAIPYMPFSPTNWEQCFKIKLSISYFNPVFSRHCDTIIYYGLTAITDTVDGYANLQAYF